MGLAEDTRRAVGDYGAQVDAAVKALQDLATAVDRCRHRLATDGPVGRSGNPDLDAARSRLDTAHRRLCHAAAAASASADQCRQYVSRSFPGT
jgi:hypothetical protein